MSRYQRPADHDQSALAALYWRDEILEVMYWLRGESLNDTPRAEALATFLATDAMALCVHLERLVAEGFLSRADDGYTLTAQGHKTGGKLFQDEFDGLTNQAHGECSDPNCACKTLGPEACVARQRSHEHKH